MLNLYNVMTRKKEEFTPIKEGEVSMYACGITVSGDAHVGHAWQAIIYDMFRKYMEYKGLKVTYVRNYTDVDDKIIERALELDMNPMDYARQQMQRTDKDLRDLGVAPANIEPKASENIKEIIEFTQKLIANGHAYATAKGDVYFDISSFPTYGKLSHIDTKQNLSGVRKQVEEGKKNDLDFALWKSAKPNEIYWESPWGKGRPGWHIECSTMSMRFLGETIDIHGGGRDLLFPHHENEIAQSEALTGKTFVHYWVHSGLVKVNGQKMSKSLGNGITIRELLDKYHPDVIKFAFLQNHYREDLNLTDSLFDLSESAIYNIYSVFKLIDALPDDPAAADKSFPIIAEIKEKFIKAMDNDLNTPICIADLFSYLSTINTLLKSPKNAGELKQIKQTLLETYAPLGFMNSNADEVLSALKTKYMAKVSLSEADIAKAISQRSQYKEQKNYEAADKIRADLDAEGILLQDTKDGTLWTLNLKQIQQKAKG